MHRDYCCNSDIKFRDLPFLLKNGASGRIRTSDRSVRSRVLYPAELRMHRESYFTAGLLSWHLRWFRKPDNNNVAVTKENMVHPGGFEPPTARFVAEYSIQLSYGCIGKLALLRVSVTTNTCHTEYDGLIGRVTRLCLALRAAAFTALFSLNSERRWCIREDSNLRPLGS